MSGLVKISKSVITTAVEEEGGGRFMQEVNCDLIRSVAWIRPPQTPAALDFLLFKVLLKENTLVYYVLARFNVNIIVKYKPTKCTFSKLIF